MAHGGHEAVHKWKYGGIRPEYGYHAGEMVSAWSPPPSHSMFSQMHVHLANPMSKFTVVAGASDKFTLTGLDLCRHGEMKEEQWEFQEIEVPPGTIGHVTVHIHPSFAPLSHLGARVRASQRHFSGLGLHGTAITLDEE